MQNNFKEINESNQTLISERNTLKKKITGLEKEIVSLKLIYPKGNSEPKKPVASPALTVAGKDSSNPLMAMDLPKVQQTQKLLISLLINTRRIIWDRHNAFGIL
ncbi:pre-mRNA-processing protein 40A-like [Abeliophyllum distichum]|uniref:Pre-mRNA-processing protein 40A-like n=1 Tax=Abeliophyllum distichum TaxID=126358 RepID=A0ABD1RV64_9LAMI